jgi:hypothetical protein
MIQFYTYRAIRLAAIDFATEKTTSIVALMRGGEAMALDINEAFPCAMSVYAKRLEDIELATEIRTDGILVDALLETCELSLSWSRLFAHYSIQNHLL